VTNVFESNNWNEQLLFNYSSPNVPQKWYEVFIRDYPNYDQSERIINKLSEYIANDKLEPNMMEFVAAILCYNIERTNKNYQLFRPEFVRYGFGGLVSTKLFPIAIFLHERFANMHEYFHRVRISKIYYGYGREFAKFVIESNIPIHHDINMLMCEACKKDDIIMFRYLVSKYDNLIIPETTDDCADVKAFTYACSHGNIEIVNYYLGKCKNVIEEPINTYAARHTLYGIYEHSTTYYGPIIVACMRNQIEVLDLLFPYLDELKIRRIGIGAFNLATLAIASTNGNLVTRLTKTYKLKINHDFIYAISKTCTLDTFIFALKYSNINDILKLFVESRDNISVSEYLIKNYDNKFLDNLKSATFFELMLSKSVLVQKEVFKRNPHYLQDVTLGTNEILSETVYNTYATNYTLCKDIIQNINEQDDRITIIIDILHEDEDYEFDNDFILIFRVNDKFLIGYDGDYYKQTLHTSLRVLDVPKNKSLINAWTNEFSSII